MTSDAAGSEGVRDLAAWVRDARRRTNSLVEDLEDARWSVPKLAIVNPFLWEIGHVGWFQERWVLRHAAGRPPIREDGDRLYDSARIPHDVRWDLPLPDREETLRYLEDVERRVLERLERDDLTDADRYFVKLSVFHEDMHGEAFLMTRQTLGYPAPASWSAPRTSPAISPAGPASLGDARVGGGRFRLGAERGPGFVFDNEKWAHDVEVTPFRIARTAVSEGEFLAFVEDGGYAREELWTEEGWAWRTRSRAEHPLTWRPAPGGGWQRRRFDLWTPLERGVAMANVNAHEAEAWCRWAGRRLPTEAEWEWAAAGPQGEDGGTPPGKRRFPWGEAAPSPEHANLDARTLGPVDARAKAAGESACGCRQTWGNVWEWTSTPFGPYPGFVPDPYEDYSKPYFGTHRVLRGGSFATRARLLRTTWRNFYAPDRRDAFTGFRTCALEGEGE